MVEELIQNQVFAGVAGAAVVSGVLYQLRALPQTLWTLLRLQFSATLTVYSEQEAFRQVELWLGSHPDAAKSRRVALAEWWDQATNESVLQMTPGEGAHLLWEGARPIFVHKTVEAAPAGGGPGGPRRQTITLTTAGRDRSLLERIVSEARAVQDRDVVPVHIWREYDYRLVERRPRRALESVNLAAGLRESIVSDARRFIDRRAWYLDRGIPHRRGYLFEGLPGTGKSTMALALAGAIGRAIYIINPASVSDDNALQEAINRAGSGLVLIEDIDAAESSRERQPKVVPTGGVESARAVSGGITTSGLLNALDGVAARDGRILVITTNHPEKLDAALLRPGRIDMRCHFGPAGLPEALEMHRRLCPEADAEAFADEIAPLLPMSQAELQNRLLRIAA